MQYIMYSGSSPTQYKRTFTIQYYIVQRVQYYIVLEFYRDTIIEFYRHTGPHLTWGLTRLKSLVNSLETWSLCEQNVL